MLFVRSLITVAMCLLCLASLAGTARAGILEEVRLEFVSGDVTGPVSGQGIATLTALVTNISDRDLNGVRIAAYYSPYDSFPEEFAEWKLHEFVFEPPLKPGNSVSLSFQDEKAYEYIQLELRRALFDLRLVVNGKLLPSAGLIRIQDGAAYMQSRELVEIIGGDLHYDAEADRVNFSRGGYTLLYKNGRRSIDVNGERRALEFPVIELDGHTWVPLQGICQELGIDCKIDNTLNVLTLEFEPLPAVQ